MEQKIEQHDIRAMNRYTVLMIITAMIGGILFPLSWFLGFIPGLVIGGLAFATTLYFSHKVEELKKQYDVQTYREIVAFSKGETLDEITKVRESGKRSYQKAISAVGAGIFGVTISLVVWWLLQVVN